MTEVLQIYKCEICGNIVEMLHAGKGELVCCGEPMELYEENTVDAAKEKHIPVKEASGEKVKVKVGSVAHPMEEKHYIEWIEIIDGDKNSKAFLEPGQEPEAEFSDVTENMTSRAYCNIHGLWKG